MAEPVLPRAHIRSCVENALTRMAEQAAERARQLAPVRSGALRNSIQATSAAWTGERCVASISADVPYALLVELGTSATPPHPFLRPAAQEAAREISSSPSF